MLRVYTIDKTYGDHVGYEVASSEYDACPNCGRETTVCDICYCYSDDEIRDIIDNELDVDEDTKKELKESYGI